MIEFVKGDFFDYQADIRINTVNCVGIMGAGVALAFKKKYPDMFKEYVEVCNRGEISPGNPHVWEIRDLFFSCTIINLPTKLHWRSRSEYEYIEKDLIWLRAYLIEYGQGKTVSLPALGCGHGGLDWGIVKGMTLRYLSDVDSNILQFEPGSSNKGLSDSDESYHTMRIDEQLFFPSDPMYPRELCNTYGKEIYTAGNWKLLSKKKICFILNSEMSERETKVLRQILIELHKKDVAFLFPFMNQEQMDLVNGLLGDEMNRIFILSCGLRKINNLQEYLQNENSLMVSYHKLYEVSKKVDGRNAFWFRLWMADGIVYCNEDKKQIKTGYKILEKVSNLFYIDFWDDSLTEFERINACRIELQKNGSMIEKPKLEALMDYIDARYSLE